MGAEKHGTKKHGAEKHGNYDFSDVEQEIGVRTGDTDCSDGTG